MRKLTVKKLKEMLNGVPDDAIVIHPTEDHEYRDAYVDVTTALVVDHNYGLYTEDHGEKFTPEAEYGKRIPVVVIS